MEAKDMLLEDALSVAIENERKLIVSKIVISGLLVMMGILLFIVGGCYGQKAD